VKRKLFATFRLGKADEFAQISGFMPRTNPEVSEFGEIFDKLGR